MPSVQAPSEIRSHQIIKAILGALSLKNNALFVDSHGHVLKIGDLKKSIVRNMMSQGYGIVSAAVEGLRFGRRMQAIAEQRRQDDYAECLRNQLDEALSYIRRMQATLKWRESQVELGDVKLARMDILLSAEKATVARSETEVARLNELVIKQKQEIDRLANVEIKKHISHRIEKDGVIACQITQINELKLIVERLREDAIEESWELTGTQLALQEAQRDNHILEFELNRIYGHRPALSIRYHEGQMKPVFAQTKVLAEPIPSTDLIGLRRRAKISRIMAGTKSTPIKCA